MFINYNISKNFIEYNSHLSSVRLRGSNTEELICGYYKYRLQEQKEREYDEKYHLVFNVRYYC